MYKLLSQIHIASSFLVSLIRSGSYIKYINQPLLSLNANRLT